MQTDQQVKIDTRAQVVTPENIMFEYALAGPFLRLPAFLFDLAFRVFMFVGLLFFLSFFAAFAPFAFGTLATVFLILLFFLLSWFYGIFCETRFNGRTLGKMVFKLRTISVDGRPINASQAALRNFLRLADMGVLLPLQILSSEAAPAFAIPTMSVGLAAMLLSRRFQRVGDMAAGTMVVVEAGQSKPWSMAPEDARAFGLSEMIPANFVASRTLATTVGLYMENRKRLSGPRRDEIATHVTSHLLPEFGMLPDTGPDLLMCALYTRIFMSDQQRSEGLERFRHSVPQTSPALRR